MSERRDPPPTDEGWYALHDFRTVDWDAWRDAPERARQRALDEAVEHLDSATAVEDADDGASAVYSVLGHKADFLVLHLRPTTADMGALERGFEQTELGRFTERATSFVSVTEASGYSERAREYFEGDLDEDSGLYRYIESRLEPTISDATHVCFYPMDKRRQPGQNWYDLPFEERAAHMDAHGEIGREYGGKVTQMITGAIGLDDWEWGVTLWGDDLTDVKDLLYEMRFDPSTSQYAEFGPFYVGRRFPPSDLEALLAGEAVPTGTDGESATGSGTGDSTGGRAVHPADAADEAGHGAAESAGHPTGAESDRGHAGRGDADGQGGAHPGRSAEGDHPHDGDAGERGDDVTARLSTLGFEAGADYAAGDYGLVLSSDADAEELADEVDGLRGNFEHYDSHVATAVRAHGGRSAIVSIWDNEGAADTAEGFLTDLPGVSDVVRGPLGSDETGASETESVEETEGASIREELADLDVYSGQPHGEDVHALVVYSRAETETLAGSVAELRRGFEDEAEHEETSVYVDADGDTAAVVSLWQTESAAQAASDALADLPGITRWAGEGDGFGTMGMFYTVKPEYREEFAEQFETVTELLDGMDGHRETALLVDREDENDMFIASRWDAKENAMDFFRSDAFADTVDWGRDVLADRPRHVFLA